MTAPAPQSVVSDMISQLRRQDHFEDGSGQKARDGNARDGKTGDDLIISRLPKEDARQKALLDRARFQDFCRVNGGWYWVMDERGCLADISGQFPGVLGRSEAEFIDQPLEEIGFLCPDEEGDMPLVVGRKNRSAFRDQLIVLTDAKGQKRNYYLSGVPVLNAQGRITGYRGTAVPAERGFGEQSDAGAEPDANPSQEAFLSNISHELRTPLNAILGFTETMRMEMFGHLSERYRHYCDDILQAGQHLLALVDDILEASELQKNGALPMNICSLTVSGLVRDTMALVGPQALDHGIALADYPVDRDYKILGDNRRVKQILVNLLSNAIKYTGAGGNAGVDVHRRDDMVAVTVWDTGPGIDLDMQAQIFERFERAGEGGYRGTQKGMGLGLHISRVLARQMGGDIVVESKPGHGSRFTLFLPGAD